MTVAEERAPEANQQGEVLLPCEKGRLLIVDDEKSIRMVFRQILSFELPEVRIDVAVNGAEAVAAFQEVRHAVLLMDLHMPVMDGETAFFEIERICRENKLEMPAVVFCTGYNPSERVRKVATAGGKHCLLQKPVSNDTLVKVLKERLY